MSPPSTTAFYDGATRPIADVAGRVERDAIACIQTHVARMQRDESAWQALVAPESDGRWPPLLDDTESSSFSLSCDVCPEGDKSIVLSMNPGLPRTLDGLHAFVRTLAWVVGSEGAPGRVVVRVGQLDAATHARVAHRLRETSRSWRESLVRGVEALERVVEGGHSPRVMAALDAGLAAMDAIDAKRQGQLDALVAP